MLESCYESIQYLFKAKYKELAIDFFSTVTDCSDICRCSEISLLLSPLLNLYDVQTFYSFFKQPVATNQKIKELRPLYHTISNNDIAKNFYLLLQDDWKEKFKEIAESNSNIHDEKSKLVIALSANCCALENTIENLTAQSIQSKNWSDMCKAQLQQSFSQELEDITRTTQQEIQKLKEEIRKLEERCSFEVKVSGHLQEKAQAEHDKAINELKMAHNKTIDLLTIKHDHAIKELKATHDAAIKSNSSEQSKKMDLFKKKILKIFVVTQLCLLFIVGLYVCINFHFIAIG
jgi:hypothetical protein